MGCIDLFLNGCAVANAGSILKFGAPGVSDGVGCAVTADAGCQTSKSGRFDLSSVDRAVK